MLYKVGTRDYAKFMRKDARQKQMALVVINENRNDITNLIKISKANRVYCYAYYELKQRVISKFFMEGFTLKDISSLFSQLGIN